MRYLPDVGVGVRGLVVGPQTVVERSAGRVRPFAPRSATLAARLAAVHARVREALHECPAQLPVVHFALYAAPCLRLLRHRPLVVHFHGPWAAESRAEGAGAIATSLKQMVERAVYRRAARVVALSRAFGRILEEQHGVSHDRIRVVPGGVDVARFDIASTRLEAKARLGWPIDRPVVLVVRRLVRRMGLETLIASVNEARRDVPDLLVLIAGRGPLSVSLQQQIDEANLEQHVRLLGFVPDEDLPWAYRAADLTVVPSVSLEGFGLIVAESLAAGTPVIVTNVGGLPETLESFAPDCIVHESGPRPLGAAISQALRGSLRLPASADCVRHATERFDWPVVAARVRSTYAEVAH
ncbi:MAG: glycosyltransferase family 4 protein [Vicinamibacterales bacterium]